MVVNGSLSKTAVNGAAGARSQLSGLIVAALTVVTLLFLTGLFEELPEATLAAVVIAALIELVDVRALVALYRFHTRGAGSALSLAARPDFIAALAALLGVLVFDTLPGLFIGIVVSLLLLLYRASRPHVAVLGKAPGASRPVDGRRAPPRERAGARDRGAPRREPRCSSRTPTRSAARSADRRTRAPGPSCSTPRSVPAIDVTAVTMLVELAEPISGATASSSSSRATSARSATSSRSARARQGSGASRRCRTLSTR